MVYESNGLLDPKAFHDNTVYERVPIKQPSGAVTYFVKHYNWADPQLDKIIRLRLLSDPGLPFWDVSYVTGILKDGRQVPVRVPFDQLPKGRKMYAAIIAHAKRDGVYAKGLGVFNAISKLC